MKVKQLSRKKHLTEKGAIVAALLLNTSCVWYHFEQQRLQEKELLHYHHAWLVSSSLDPTHIKVALIWADLSFKSYCLLKNEVLLTFIFFIGRFSTKKKIPFEKFDSNLSFWTYRQKGLETGKYSAQCKVTILGLIFHFKGMFLEILKEISCNEE